MQGRCAAGRLKLICEWQRRYGGCVLGTAVTEGEESGGDVWDWEGGEVKVLFRSNGWHHAGRLEGREWRRSAFDTVVDPIDRNLLYRLRHGLSAVKVGSI